MQRVEAIQADTDGAVAAIGQISSIIAEINDYQTTIASAVEEQTATSPVSPTPPGPRPPRSPRRSGRPRSWPGCPPNSSPSWPDSRYRVLAARTVSEVPRFRAGRIGKPV
jgi:hypothetical protein